MRSKLSVVLALLLTFASATLAAQAEPTVERPSSAEELTVVVETSRVLSLLYFARAALEHPHTSPALRALYESKRDTLGAADPLSRIRTGLASAPGSIGYRMAEAVGDGRYDGIDALSLLELRAGASQDLTDFAARISGLLPVAAQAEFIAGLRELEPLHEAHVWGPSQSFLKKMRRDLQRQARRTKMGERLAEAATFYGTQWPAEIPIRIYLVPVPGDVTVTTAHSIGAVQIVDVIEGDDVAGRLSVLFHEICHGFWNAQPPELRRAIARATAEHPLPVAAIASQQLNEGLATALGNGWFEWLQKGEATLSTSWYADDIVDAYAKRLFPLVQHYVERGIPLDRGFLNRAVALFSLAFPHADERPALILRSMELFRGRSVAHEPAEAALRRWFRISSMWSSSPLDHESTQSRYVEKAVTPVFVLTADDLPRLRAYDFYPTLREVLVGHFADAPFILPSRVGDGRMKLFVGVRTTDELEPLIEALARTPRLEDGQVVRSAAQVR